jgi:hypothetical protein
MTLSRITTSRLVHKRMAFNIQQDYTWENNIKQNDAWQNNIQQNDTEKNAIHLCNALSGYQMNSKDQYYF